MDVILNKIFGAAYEAMLGEGGDGTVLIIITDWNEFPWDDVMSKWDYTISQFEK